MPVNENSYENGKLYRIWSLKTNDIYVGSSCDTLSHRFSVHKKDYKRWKEGDKTRYCSSYILFDQIGVENCKIELIKNFPCNSKAELNREEGKVMREYKDIIVNKQLAGRTQKEYYEHNKKEISEKAKEYYEHNKKEISEKTKEYYEHNKKEISEKTKEYYEHNKKEISEKAKEYYQENKKKAKEYYEHNKKEILEKAKEYYEHNKKEKKDYYQEHKEEILEKNKEYREKHKEQTKEYHKEYYQERKEQLQKKYDCECGGKYTHQHKLKHEKTQRHQDYLKSQ